MTRTTRLRHAVWSTPPPPVSTGNWDQEALDSFAAAYRPDGYTGGMHDQTAYNQWTARRALMDALAYHKGGLTAVPHPRATMVDIWRYIRVAQMCRCRKCFCCSVYDATNGVELPMR